MMGRDGGLYVSCGRDGALCAEWAEWSPRLIVGVKAVEARSFLAKLTFQCLHGGARCLEADMESSWFLSWGAVLIRFEYINIAVHSLRVSHWPLHAEVPLHFCPACGASFRRVVAHLHVDHEWVFQILAKRSFSHDRVRPPPRPDSPPDYAYRGDTQLVTYVGK